MGGVRSTGKCGTSGMWEHVCMSACVCLHVCLNMCECGTCMHVCMHKVIWVCMAACVAMFEKMCVVCLVFVCVLNMCIYMCGVCIYVCGVSICTSVHCMVYMQA